MDPAGRGLEPRSKSFKQLSNHRKTNMPRNMSFALTTEQFKNQTKTVTRRRGWTFLKPGDVIMGCNKCMGLKPGEKLERLGLIKVVSVSREPLNQITNEDVTREGFPDMDKENFIHLFLTHMGGPREQLVTRIEFEYV